jgi:hypothetical protein
VGDNARIVRHGDRYIVELPAEAVAAAGFADGTDVEIRAEPSHIEIVPGSKPGAELLGYAAEFFDRYDDDLRRLADS